MGVFLFLLVVLSGRLGRGGKATPAVTNELALAYARDDGPQTLATADASDGGQAYRSELEFERDADVSGAAVASIVSE